MKILVTGANGYLGQGVVKALLDNGHSVVAADFKTNYVDGLPCSAKKKQAMLSETMLRMAIFGTP